MLKKILLTVFVSLIAYIFIFLGCDEYNITEPRYYANDDVLETLDECPDSTTYPGMLPNRYNLHICWFTKSENILKIELELPTASTYQINIINSGGEILYEKSGFREAGEYRQFWNCSDFEGVVYGVTVTAGEYKAAIWFEMK